MKELTIEEKAKAYDKAFERVKELLSRCTDNRDRRTKVYRVEDIESIFPELKDSEDEKMWKLIKKYAHYNISDMALDADHITREQLESWLEKQGKKKSIDYTHTNVFTEKAAIWFNNNFIVHDEYGVISDSFDIKEEMFEDFKNYMKEE